MSNQNAGGIQMQQYSSVRTSENDDKPPIYKKTFIGDLQELVRSGEKRPAKLGQSAYEILCNSVFTSVLTLVSALLPIAQLVVGIMFKNECVIQPNIPLWLIVFGAGVIVVALMRIISTVIIAVKSRKGGDANEFRCLTCIISLLSIFLFIWFIIGNYWVYSIFSRVQYDPLAFPKDYCHKFAYLFSFWSITATWIMVALFVICFATIIIVVLSIALSACCAAKD